MIVNFSTLISFLALLVCGVSSNPGVFNVKYRYPRLQGSLSALKEHDDKRQLTILAGIDLPLGGTGRPDILGLYYAKIGIGTPAKSYYVQVDTGSDIMWVNCIQCKQCPKRSNLGIELTLYDIEESESAKLVSCDEDFCYQISGGPLSGCKANMSCPYLEIYGDGSSTAGYFVKDVVQYDSVAGDLKTKTANGSVIFGCGARQSGDLDASNEEALDGILGFGKANSSMISQLASSGRVKKIFAHCLDGRNGGGIFAIGRVVQPKVNMTPLVPNQPHYNVNMTAVQFTSMAALSSVQCLSSCSSHHHHQRAQSGSRWRLSSRGLVSSSLWKISMLSGVDLKRRRHLICAVKGGAAEGAFKKTVELDRMIDALKDASPRELEKLVVENILAFDEVFWIRLATRSDTCKSDDDKKDYEELAATVMTIVDCVVNKTREKIESSTDVLKGILRPVVEGVEEITWPPRDPDAINQMENEIIQREKEGQLDEGFLSEVSAQLRQAKEDKDKPGLAAMLQKVLQLYAATVLSKRSYAKKGNEVVKAEHFLETLIKAPEEQWNKLFLEGLTLGKGEVSPDELSAVIKKRVERTLIRTEGGSYQQRILIEYLKGIESRANEIMKLLQG